MKKIFLIILVMVLLAGCKPTVTKKDVITGQAVYDKEEVIFNTELYLDSIVYDDYELKILAKAITEECRDNECRIFNIYRYVVMKVGYLDEGDDETIQSPSQTLEIKTGDCEDMTILLMSLLENTGIKTYLVYSGNHVYSLTCGIDKENLVDYIRTIHYTADIFITYYDAFGNESCIVMDATNGAEAYPGYDAGIIGDKKAIDAVTEQIEVLE